MTEDADGVSAFDLLECYINQKPDYRCVDRIAKIGGCWLVELRDENGVHTSSSQKTISGAIRNVIMVAAFARAEAIQTKPVRLA